MNTLSASMIESLDPVADVESALKLDLPDIFAYAADRTKARLPTRNMNGNGSDDHETPQQIRGSLLLVESDEEVARLVSRLLQYEGYEVI
ncbi:MAG: response regulator transcription factor, partial [Verrucomicrobiae bacterium]|nr:response regulator transcription factor [Verrucomicrobiae bacterium]